MRKGMKTSIGLFALSLIFCLLFTSLSFGQEMPKPGEVIDKSNYKKYAHLFPEEFLPGFEDGMGGFWKPFVIKVIETKPYGLPDAFVALSEKNRGKFTIDKDGFIAGGFDYIGLPFPGLTKDDKDFGTKFMYNFNYRYMWDDAGGGGGAHDCEKRKGEPIANVDFQGSMISFINRLFETPKPKYDNPVGLQGAQTLIYTYPPGWKNMGMLQYTYLDPKRHNEIYLYLPTMRRVVRGDAGQSSTPIQGTTQSFDDFNGGFNGKVFEFTFKLLGERKVLGSADTPWRIPLCKRLQAEGGGALPFSGDNFSVRDVYIIEVKSKDPKYPQSNKILYIDKDTLSIYYAMAWDRAGKFWKTWFTFYAPEKLANGDVLARQYGQFGIDVQVGYATSFVLEGNLNGNGFKYADFMPSILGKKGR